MRLVSRSPTRNPACPSPLPSSRALFLFSFVVVAWGLSWPITKFIVTQVSPLWATAIRTGIAALALLATLIATKQLIIPRRGDIRVILAISLFHMVGFGALMSVGLRYIPAGRAVVLGYTTPLWVLPGAWLFLREDLPPRRLAGIFLGLSGLCVLFNPLALEWELGPAILGNGILLLAALAWSVSILYTRAHQWNSTPFQLVFWQALLAGLVLVVLALAFEELPHVIWTETLVLAFAYSGLIGTALGFWAMAVVNRSLPATTTSLGTLATPVVGIAASVALLGEQPDLTLIVAATLVVVGIAIGSFRHS